MRKKFNTTMTKCDPKTFDLVKDVMWRSRGEELVKELEALFDTGVPANGYRVTSSGTAYTYLSLAYQSMNHDALEYLIRQGYNELAEFGWTFSQYLWHENVAQALLDVGHTFVNEINDPECPFWSNAEGRSPDFFKTIAQRGAQINSTVIKDGVACPRIVQIATLATSPRLVETLLASGVDPDSRQADGYSVLHAAVTQGRAKHLKENDSAANSSRLEKIVQAVVAAGGDVNMVDNECRSALHLACKFGYPNKAMVLLEAGADHTLKDKDGNTPEDLARIAKRRDVLVLFAAMRARNKFIDVVAKASRSAAPDQA